MKSLSVVSGLAMGLSTFLASAQTTPVADVAKPATEAGPGNPEKPDVNEIIRTANQFTNSIGMLFKKTGSGLWVSVYETTQKDYQEVSGSNPSAFPGDKRPVDSVSWQRAVDFCRELTDHEAAEQMLPEGYHYALPTQAQWESLAAGVPLSSAVTGSTARRSTTAEVGSLSSSRDGLYDLRGNVAEWCADPADGSFRVLRGGSWADWIEINLRPEFRVFAPPGEAKNTFGFRCVLTQGE